MSPETAPSAKRSPLTPPPHEACGYVRREYGQDLTLETYTKLLELVADDPVWEALPDQLANEIKSDLPFIPPEQDPPSLEERAYAAQRCASCVLHTLCTVEDKLIIPMEAKEQIRLLNMLATSPPWLTRALIHNAGMTYKQFERTTASHDAAAAMLQLLGDVHNRPLRRLIAADIPKPLQSLPSIHDLAAFDAHHISFANRRHTYAVCDLSLNDDYTGPRLREKHYNQLMANLLESMREPGRDELPPIVNPGLHSQYPIAGGGFVAIIRGPAGSQLHAAVLPSLVHEEPHQLFIISVQGKGGQRAFRAQPA